MIGWVLGAALAAEPASNAAADSLDRLQRVYQQSCAERAYGSYNDLCHQMRQDIRRYSRQVAADKHSLKPAAPSSVVPAPGMAGGAIGEAGQSAPTFSPNTPR